MTIQGHEKLDQQFKALGQSPGAINIKLAAGSYQNKNVRIIIPKKGEEGPKPLIIALHWAGGGNTYTGYSQCLIQPVFVDLDAYIIIPDAENMVWTNDYNEKKILELLALAKENWNIDSTKILVTGYSNGGNGAWYFADKHSDKITTAIPMASAYAIDTKINIPLYVIHGENDELFNIERTHNWVKSAQEAGSDIVFKPVLKYSHYMACDYVAALKEAVSWLEWE